MTAQPTFNPTDPTFIADPYPAYRFLRHNAPVVWVDALSAWVVSRYNDIQQGLRDPHLGVDSGNTTAFRFLESLTPEMAGMAEMFNRQMLFLDPPQHTRLRGLVNKAFTPRVVQQLQPKMEHQIDLMLDAVAAAGEMDVIGDLAYPLPVTVIAFLLGVPVEDHGRFKTWSNPIVRMVEPILTPAEIQAAAKASLEMLDYFADLIKKKRTSPGEDLLSALIHAEEHGQRLTLEELLANAVLLLVAGHETTVNLIGNGVLALMEHPQEGEKLRQNPEKLENAVEEILRYDSPVQIISRVAKEEWVLQGTRIKPGQEVLFLLGAGNRDEEKFTNPDRFHIDRTDIHPLSFGGGPHYCVGAPLARLEAQLSIGKLMERFNSFEILEPPLRRASATLRGVEQFKIRFRLRAT